MSGEKMDARASSIDKTILNDFSPPFNVYEHRLRVTHMQRWRTS